MTQGAKLPVSKSPFTMAPDAHGVSVGEGVKVGVLVGVSVGSGACGGGGGGAHGDVYLVEVDVLLCVAADQCATVYPGVVGCVAVRTCIVIVTGVGRLDVGVGLVG